MTKQENLWQVIIFMVGGKANHAGLSIPDYGLADLSLLGARIVSWNGPSLPKGERVFFDFPVTLPEPALIFLKQPGLLCNPIIQRERSERGWHLTFDAPDFVRTLRDVRSHNPEDMNCVEWIVKAMELALGQTLPNDLMTPTELLRWSEKNLSSSK